MKQIANTYNLNGSEAHLSASASLFISLTFLSQGCIPLPQDVSHLAVVVGWHVEQPHSHFIRKEQIWTGKKILR